MRVALIEVGHWHSRMHLRSLQKTDAVIAGVSDHQPGTAKAFAGELGCPAFQDWRAMLDTTRPDLVVAMGRHADMPAIARGLLEAGIPFAIEKPTGLNASQLAPLVELAKERHAFAAVALTNRYSALWETLDRLEQAGRAGIRSHAHFRVVNGPPDRYEADGVGWMLDPALSGGGALRNLGMHAADAFIHFARETGVQVIGAAISTRVYGRAVEEFASALLRSASGILGTVEAGYSFASRTAGDFELRVATSNCYLVDHDCSLRVATLDDGQIQDIAIPAQAERIDRFVRDTIDRVRAGQPPVASLEDCYRAAQLVDEIYRRAVRVPCYETTGRN